jgi:putative copper resistance protein D
MWSAALALISGFLWFTLAMTAMGAFGSMIAATENRLVWVWVVRLTLAAALTYVLAVGQRRWLDLTVLIGSAIFLVSLAGLSHDGTQSGAAAAVHIAVDVIHLVASGVWVGALVILTLMLFASARQRSKSDLRFIHDALARFSGVGPGIVIALILSGIANSGLIGPQNALQSFGSTYSQVLVAKIGLFVLMLLLAAANRYWLTPKLQSALGSGKSTQASIHALTASIVVETVLAVLVLAAVGWLGVLAPPGAG